MPPAFLEGGGGGGGGGRGEGRGTNYRAVAAEQYKSDTADWGGGGGGGGGGWKEGLQYMSRGVT